MAPSHLLFDLAGVLATFDRQPRLDVLARLSGLDPDEVDGRLYRSGFVDAADAGELDAGEVRTGISDRLGLTCPPEEIETAWMAAFAQDDAALAVVDRARPATAALLSNNDALVGRLIPHHLPGVATRCDPVVVSGDLGVRKPSAAAYEAMLSRLGVEASACVFDDDQRSNVDGARAAGIDSVLYAGPDGLARDLAMRGVIVL